MEDAFATPEEAARGRTPPAYARALAVSVSPDERFAAVLLGMNEPPLLCPYLVLCEREARGWVEGDSANMSMSGELGEGDQRCAFVAHWDEAPGGTRAAIVKFAGREHQVPVVDRFFLFVAWGVADWREIPELLRYV